MNENDSNKSLLNTECVDLVSTEDLSEFIGIPSVPNLVLDSDIQNELLELANQVTHAFQYEEAKNECKDEVKLQDGSENKVQQENKQSVLYESFKDIQNNTENVSTKLKDTHTTADSNKHALDEVNSDLHSEYNENDDDANDLIYNEDCLENDDEYKLPEVDWVNLEAKLKEAQLEVNQQVNNMFIYN